MAVVTYNLSLLNSGVIEVRVGKHVEYISLLFKEKGDIFDQVKYALVSKEAFVSNERLTLDLHHLIWRYL